VARAVPLPVALAIACASFLLAAWAPTLQLPAARFTGVIVLDVTQSMNAEDYVADGKPASRLAAAKSAIRGAVEALPCGSQVGWGVFTEFRTLLLIAPIEVCANFSELDSVLDGIDGRMAWAGASEVAKGIHSALREAAALRGRPAIVFVTDGHEAPPVNPGYRPRFGGRSGEIAGLIVGAGGPTPVPIPKLDLDGRRLGYWGPDDVLQTDPYSRGRTGSVAGERYVGADAVKAPPGWPPVGNEHLSHLREGYLRLLADELELGYLRLDSVGNGARALAARLQTPPLARVAPADVSLRVAFGALGLLAVAWVYGGALLGAGAALFKRGRARGSEHNETQPLATAIGIALLRRRNQRR
jgi:mxaL protein